jgi:DNA-directed RNA polymerase specialized sigma subunit
MEMIEGVNAPERKELLELRYLCGMTWERVGQRMRYDKRQSQRIHKRALEDVQRQMDERGIRR